MGGIGLAFGWLVDVILLAIQLEMTAPVLAWVDPRIQ